MPMPEPDEDQSRDEFVSECMSDDTMKREYEREQRIAVCYSIWRESQEEEED